jgi:putative ABC transport system substrate-binding protein
MRYSAEGRTDRFPELARDVVQSKPNLILAASNELVLSFKAATDTIPIVGFLVDPVTFGVVDGLARPGGNITGVCSDPGSELWEKRLQILQQLIPGASKMGFLIAGDAPIGNLQEVARRANISLIGYWLHNPINEVEYHRVLGEMVQEHIEGLIVSDVPTNFTYAELIVDLVGKARLPTIYPSCIHFDLGGPITYAPGSTVGFWRLLGGCVDKIFNGAKPGDMPIYQGAKIDLLVNLKMAKSLGITVPPSLLARADEVIE